MKKINDNLGLSVSRGTIVKSFHANLFIDKLFLRGR